MANLADFMVADLREKYEAVPSSRAFKRLYDDPEWGHMFAVLHKRLNEHFTDINGRAETTRHYWADNSRDLLSLIQEIEADLHTLRRAGVEVELADSYQEALERLIRDPKLRERLGKAAREKAVANYSTRAMARVYQQVLTGLEGS